MNNVVIDFSAFTKQSGNFAKPLMITTLKWGLFALVLYTIANIILYALPPSSMHYGETEELIMSLTTVVMIIGFFKVVWRAVTYPQQRQAQIFMTFAAANGFNFNISSQAHNLTSFGILSSDVIHISNVIYGNYSGKNFRIYTYKKTGNYGGGAHYGVLEVQLSTFYPTFIINKSINNHPFVTLELIATAKAMNGSKVELIDDIIYFVTDDGMDMTPEGMAKIFQLIELASQLDT